MKLTFQFTSALVAAALAVPTISMAATKAEESVSISKPAKIGDSQLQAGNYKVVWDGAGPNVQVSFLQGKKTVATVPAKLVEHASTYNSIESSDADNNYKILSIAWKKQSLVFANPASGQQAGQ
jgi:uncharacterized protein with FMN-binding domain